MILTMWLSASLVLEINFQSLFLQPPSVGKVDRLCKQPLHILLFLACLCFASDRALSQQPSKDGMQGTWEEGFPPASPVAASVFLSCLQLPAVTRVQSLGRSPMPPDFPLSSRGQKQWHLLAANHLSYSTSEELHYRGLTHLHDHVTVYGVWGYVVC